MKREDLPEDMQAAWERGSPGFVGIEGYFSKDRVRLEGAERCAECCGCAGCTRW
ncbi:MAG: hypothetical protein ABI700_01750 [Chloroflexota bacterium]